jgi:O-antigen/teichoic acid export membrane protein
MRHDLAMRMTRYTGILLGGMFVSKLLGFLYSVVVIRYLDPVGRGVYSTALALTTLFAVLMNWDLDLLVAREVARDPRKGRYYLLRIGCLKVLSALLLLPGVWGICRWGNFSPEKTRVVVLFHLVMMGDALTATLFSVLRGSERVGRQAFLEAGRALLSLGAAGLVIFSRWGLAELAWLLAGVQFFCVLAGGAGVLRLGGEGTSRVSPVELWEIVRSGRHLSANYLTAMVFLQTNLLVLSFLQGDVAAGRYWVPTVLVTQLMLLPAQMMNAGFPLLSQEGNRDGGALSDLYHKTSKWLAVVGWPCAMLLWGMPREVLTFLYGDISEESVRVMRVLCGNIVWMYLGTAATYALYALGKERHLVLPGIVRAGLNLGLALWWVPMFGPWGAAWAALCAITVHGIWMFRCLGKEMGAVAYGEFLGKPLWIGVGVGGIVLLTGGLPLPWRLSLLAVVYLGLLAGFRLLTGGEWFQVRRLLRLS